MAFDFSLTQNHITPIRPQKIDQLFSPSLIKTPTRILNDMTYQVAAKSVTNQVVHGGDDTSMDLPALDRNFPRQSTVIKMNKQIPLASSTTFVRNNQDETVASKTPDRQALLPPSDDMLTPQYRPIHILKDPSPVRATCFHPFGDVYCVGSNSKALRICMYPTQEELRGFTNQAEPTDPEIVFKFVQIHRSSVYCVTFNNAGDLLATGSNDQTVHIIRYHSEKHQPVGSEYKLTMHSGTVRDLCFMHNDYGKEEPNYLISAGVGGEIYLTDCKIMKQVRPMRDDDSTVMSLHRWNDVNLFASGSLDGSIRLWDIRIRRGCVSSFSSGQTNNLNGDQQQQSAPVGVVRVEPTGKLLVSGHSDGRCMLYDVRGSRVMQTFKAHDDEIRTLNFSPKSYYLLTASYDHKIKLMDLQGDLTQKLPSVDLAELSDKVVQTAWHPSEYTFISTCADGTATLWTVPETFVSSYE